MMKAKNSFITIEQLLVALLVIGFSLPVTLPVSVPVSTLDIIMFVVVVILGLQNRLVITAEFFFVIGAIFLSIFFYIIDFLFLSKSVSFRPLASIAYFFKPYFAYLVGYCLFNKGSDIRIFLSFVVFIFVMIICMPVIVAGDDFRTGIKLFGFHVFGSEGVNSLMVYLATLLLFFNSSRAKLTSNHSKIFTGCLLVISLLVILLSSSRQAILGVVLFYFIILLHGKVRNLVFATFMFVFVITTFYSMLPDTLLLKLNRDIAALSNADLGSFSAGRTHIYNAMFVDILENPIFGNKFNGFTKESLPPEFLYAKGLSPHNQYLGAIWKMGLFSAVLYFVFLILSLRFLWKVENSAYPVGKGYIAASIVVLLVFMNTQDFLTFALTGYLFMLLLGSFRRIYVEQKNKVMCRSC